jgi:hypothetical protein
LPDIDDADDDGAGEVVALAAGLEHAAPTAARTQAATMNEKRAVIRMKMR